MAYTRVVVLLTVLAAPASAVDGVIEINQACATNTGCFDGDSAGFPVTITAPGSYRLTSNLTLPSVDQTGLSIEDGAPGTTLDLNGFAIIGPATCARDIQNPLTVCSGTGTGNFDAVVSGFLADGVTVKNGRVQGAGRYGVLLQGRQSRIERVVATQNGASGLVVNTYGLITNSHATMNGIDGMFVDSGSIVSHNIGNANGRNGMNAEDGDVLIQGNTYAYNDDDGIETGVRSLIKENVIVGNGGFGLNKSSVSLPSIGGYAHNLIEGNGGTVAAGVDLGGNLCDGSTTCP